MKKLYLLSLIANSAWAVCTTSVTSPMAASVQSGVVNWTRSVAGCPTGTTTEWILDDFYSIGVIIDSSGTLTNYNTGIPEDGPFNVKVIIRDGAGSILATSADVSFVIQNFGLGSGITVTSPASFQSTPVVSGTMTFTWTTSHSPITDIQNVIINIDGQEVSSSVIPTFPHVFTYDTTQLINGKHLVTSKGECIQSSICGGPSGGSTVPRIFIGFMVDIENGTTLRGVQPNISDVSMIVGQTQTLSALLAQTDGTTTSGTFTYTLDHACIPAEQTQTQLPFLCTSGNTFPLTNAQGVAYISLSSLGPTASPVTITALKEGQTYITVTDNISGKSSTVVVTVRDTLNVRHFGTCGAIYSNYTTTGGCPSIIRTSAFNQDANDPEAQGANVQTNYTAYETGWYQQPQTFATFGAWQTAFQNNFQTPINNQLAAMPGLCTVLRSDSLTGNQKDLIEAQQGPSALWVPSDPVTYSLQQLQLTNRMCGTEQRDEADQGFGFNPSYSMKFSDFSISKIVCKSNVCMVYPGTPGLYPISPIYGAWNSSAGRATFIRGASSIGLNGSHPTTCAFRSDWNLWYTNTPYCLDPNSSASVADSYTFTTSGVADGTYNSGTDPSLEILGWGDYVGYSGQQMLNTNFSYIVSKFRSAGVPQAWPTISIANFQTNLYWQGPSVADYFDGYVTFNAGGANDNSTRDAFPWGQSYYSYFMSHYNKKWGSFGFIHQSPYWRGNAKGYVFYPQKVPQILEVGLSTTVFTEGGYPISISSMSGSTLTTNTPHGVIAPSGTVGVGTNYIKIQISGNSDPAMNTNWFAYPIGLNTLRVYNTGPKIIGCNQVGAAGLITIRGIVYTIKSGYTELDLDPTGSPAPSDLVPGELMTISGAGAPCANITGAFAGYGANSFVLHISQLANSTGTNGTVLINQDQGLFNALYDINRGSNRFGAQAGQLLYAAGLGYSGMREYQAPSSVIQSQLWKSLHINDGVIYQSVPSANTNQWINFQQRWWESAPPLAFLKRATPLYLQKLGASPWISPGPPFVVSTVTNSATFGNILNTWNVSEVVQVVSVPLGAYCQVGSNPISVYTMSYPHSFTDQLTGAQTNYSLTMNPGQVTTFICHTSSTSFVQPTAISVSPPVGTATIAIQQVYGNFSGPLPSYTKVATTGASSPVTLNLDSGWSSIWYQPTYLDAGGNVISQGALVNIPSSSTPITLPVITTTSPLPNATQGMVYSTTLAASNGPITWAVSSGTLPIGLNLAPSTGVISGTPTGVGTTFGVTATNASGSTSSTFTLNVLSAPTITSASPLASGQINLSYSNQLMAIGSSPITWVVTSGTLPNGLVLSSEGLISGVPGVVGSNTFGVTATNSVGSNGKTFTLAINPAPATAPTITSSSPLPGGTQNVAYSATIAVTGTSPITCTVTSGSLPTGLSLGSSSCIISGVPTGSGASSFTLTASNSAGSNAKAFSLTITAAGVPPVITSLAPLPPGLISTPYSTTILASGSTPITWALVAGALPVGFSLNTSTGVISGTTSIASTYNFTLSATNSAGSTQQAFILPISSGSGITINGSVILNGNIVVH